MKHIYAPWRSDYILQKLPFKGCFFCKNAKSKKDKENFVLHRGKHAFVLLNLYPYNDGHLLIACYRHAASPEDLSRQEWNEVNDLTQKGISVLKKKMKPNGFNVGMNVGKVSGAGVADHLHVHVVPRWLGDTNFMPVLAETKLMNQDLSIIYEKLKSGF